jgi:tRNA(fMet)-specific endonuclease VapC
VRYLLDSNVWIQYLKNHSTPIEARLRRTPADEIVTCSIVWAELLYGARKYGRRDIRETLIERTLEPFDSLPFDDSAARHYAEIRDELERRGELIGPNDLMIAAITRCHQLTLVSSDAEFRRVSGLQVEDWTLALND